MRTALVLTLMMSLVLTGAEPNPSGSWRPRGTYWDTYRSVIVKAVCDTLGNLKQAEVIYSAVSPAETDSILEIAKAIHLGPRVYEGRVRKSGYEPVGKDEIEYIIPYTPRDMRIKTKPVVTRKELEQAGLSSWLEVWDRLLPDWPVETWSYGGSGDYYTYTSTIDDAQRDSLGMISISPNKRWHLHPFVGVELTDSGRLEGDVDGGFAVYTLGDSVRVRQYVTGTPVTYCSAEWIDDHRFVVTGSHETDLDYPGKLAFYRAPLLYLGDVMTSKFTWIIGPPVFIDKTEAMWKDLNAYQKTRYPKIADQLH